jgi:cell division transport system ATP-binding protein
MVELFHVSKRYGQSHSALDDVTLQIKKGEFVFVTGPSGAGKSTLLRLMFALEQPDSGQILIQNVNTAKLRPRAVPYFRRGIGFIFQDFKLFSRRDVYQNVAIAMRVAGAPDQSIDDRVRQVLALVGLEHKRTLLPTMLSYGEQQRLCIARAVVNHPSLLLADEPTGNLDQELAGDILALLKDLNTRGTTVIVATHDRELIARLPRRVITLKAGRVERDEAGA